MIYFKETELFEIANLQSLDLSSEVGFGAFSDLQRFTITSFSP